MDDTQTATFDFLKDVQRSWLVGSLPRLQAFAERSGATQADAVSIVQILLETLVSSADNLSDLLLDAHVFIARQLVLNETLCRMYAVAANQRAIHAGIKAGLGRAAEHFDVEGMCGQAWMRLLAHLPTYQFSGPKQEAAYLREVARNIARNELSTYRKRLKSAGIHQVDMVQALPGGYALNYEDLEQVAPDPDRRPPIE